MLSIVFSKWTKNVFTFSKIRFSLCKLNKKYFETFVCSFRRFGSQTQNSKPFSRVRHRWSRPDKPHIKSVPWRWTKIKIHEWSKTFLSAVLSEQMVMAPPTKQTSIFWGFSSSSSYQSEMRYKHFDTAGIGTTGSYENPLPWL